MGLLGSMVAGGVKKVADGRVADIEQQEEFNMKNALLDAQIEKELRLKEAGYQMEKQRAETEAKEVKAITDTVVDPMAGKGGYEDESSKVKRDYDLVSQKVSKLREAGKNDAADRLQKDLDRIDSKNNKEAALELKQLIAENKIKNQQGLLNLKEQALEQQGKIADAKNETQLARIEAANARSGDKKKSMDEQEYESYVEQIKAQGKKPLSLYQFNNWKASKRKQGDSDTVTTKTETMDDDGNVTTTSRVSKASNKPKTNETTTVRTYDPKTRSFK
jgi:hypothetical protein